MLQSMGLQSRKKTELLRVQSLSDRTELNYPTRYLEGGEPNCSDPSPQECSWKVLQGLHLSNLAWAEQLNKECRIHQMPVTA